MKTVESVCKELRALDGVVGAFVLQKLQCVASSLPPQYDANRLSQVGATLSRISQMAQKSGYDRCASAFHWQRASLLSWPIAEDGVLGLLAMPTAVRETINLSATVAVEELANLLAAGTQTQPNGTAAPSNSVEAQAHEPNSDRINALLREIEQLLVEELGLSGKSLLERCRAKTPRGNASATAWLFALRNTIVADIAEPGARVTLATSHLWTQLD